MKKIRLAVVGATGLVGRTVLKVLEEKKLPIDEYVLFASKNSSGKKLRFMDRDYIVQELNDLSFDSCFDYAIFSAGGKVAKKYTPLASSKGCIVVDNSSAFRMDNDVPLVVPEVNPEEIKNNHGIIANPNCSTIQAVVALKPLDTKYKIKRIVYSTYQAVSGAGRNGVLDLQNGIIDYMQKFSEFSQNENSNALSNDLNFSSTKLNYELQKFNYPIFSNCLPHIDVFLDNGYTKEEEKMINETRKILKRPDLKITATAVRVPVFNAHSESINVEFENDFDLTELKNILSNAPGIVLQDDTEKCIYPLAINASGHDNVFVGRVRRDYSVDYGINFWVVADNIRKGAASNAVQIVEKMLKEC